jgi:hypothetical protein
MSLFKISPKTLVLGGIAIAAAAGALKNRDKVAGLLGARSSAPEPPRPEPVPRPAAPSNYDIAGPAANTATKVPAPEAVVLDEDGGIDEKAEEEAAAAEAAAIGGATPDYPGTSIDAKGDESTRPLEEAGEGESEGEELAEYDLIDEAESQAGDASDAEAEIEEAIEAAGNPAVGETDERKEIIRNNGHGEAEQATFGFAGGKVADPAEDEEPEAIAEAGEGDEDEGPEIHPDQTSLLEEGEEEEPEPDAKAEKAPKEKAGKEKPAAEKSSAVWEPPKSPDAKGEGGEDDDPDDDGGSEWQTWSGRAVK